MKEVLREAKRLYDLGFAVHWLKPKSKAPVESGWTTGPRKPWKYLEETYHEGLNLGVRLGHPSVIGGKYLTAVDVDVKSGDKKHRAEAMSEVKKLINVKKCPVVMSGRGNGSRHYYCTSDNFFKPFDYARSGDLVSVYMPHTKPSQRDIQKLDAQKVNEGFRLRPAWEISVMSEGRQIVLPPSIHPDSGQQYTWGPRRVTDAHDLVSMQFEPPQTPVASPAAESVPVKPVTQGPPFSFTLEPVMLEAVDITRDMYKAITEGEGVNDRSGFLMRASAALLSAGLTQNEVLNVLTDPKTFMGATGYEHTRTRDQQKAAHWIWKYTVKRIAAERDPTGVFGKASDAPAPKELTPEEVAAQDAELSAERSWKQNLDLTQHKKVKNTLKNLNLILTNAVDQPLFKKDMFANRIAYGVSAPWGPKPGDYVQDIDVTLIKHWLGTNEFNIEPSKEAIFEATDLIAHHERVHPVREWLESLKWDGKPRINTWLRDFCEGRASEPFLSEVSRKFLLAMIKRVFEPGCQWDYTLVLEGGQGNYKSSIARAIASDKWFLDHVPDLKDKDSMLNLQGKWLIELGELTNVKRSDHNAVKQYLVRRVDTVRPHYGRIMSDVPRQSVFIGTVNEGQYLKDPTGNRRFWPVKVGLCDVKALELVRDQLFAEAMHVYTTAPEVLMLSPEGTKQAVQAQDERRIEDDHTEMRDALQEFVDSEHGKEFDFSKFRIKDLMYGVGVPWGRWADKNYAVQTASTVLQAMGFECRRINGFRVWGRVETENTSTPDVDPPTPDNEDFY